MEGNKVTFKHVRLPGELTMAADKIILAVGQHARLDAFAELEPQRNTIKTQNYQTRDPQVFAAGDIVEGDKTVVYAVKTGKEAAEGDSSLFRGSLLMLTKDLSITFCGVKFPTRSASLLRL
ncbi:putative oxidoreductase [Escherichia coli]|uniref:Putative oxidoreductase n=1 Tax=Escherichia coli TaxID=562 RepID=A0A376KSX9_ECOLX|nr:putative oxidoreductase [Escherichia coli]